MNDDYFDPLAGKKFVPAEFKCQYSDDVFTSSVLVDHEEEEEQPLDYMLLQIGSLLESNNVELLKTRFSVSPDLSMVDKMTDSFVHHYSDITNRLEIAKSDESKTIES